MQTAEEILAYHHGIKPEYLGVHIGKITTARNVEAMHSHTEEALTDYRADILSIMHQGGDEEDISKLDLRKYNL